MNSTAKTILSWVLILVAATGLYQFVERGNTTGQTVLNMTQFLNEVRTDNVLAVTISGQNLTGKLRNNSAFTSIIPLGYSPIYAELTQHNVQVMIIPPDSNPWLYSFVITGGLIVWFAISVVILVVLLDLSRLLKQRLAHTGGSPASL